jgi:hypothetical protein
LRQGGNLVLNWLWYPSMQAFADGRPIHCDADQWGRISVPIAGPAAKIQVWYLPDWETGLQIAGVLALVSLLATAILQIYRKPIDALSARFDQAMFGLAGVERAAAAAGSAARATLRAAELAGPTRNSRPGA